MLSRKAWFFLAALTAQTRCRAAKVVATAKEVKEPKEAKLTYRVKYKTKDGDRQTSNVYTISLFP